MKRWMKAVLAGILLTGCAAGTAQNDLVEEEPALLDTLEDPYAYAEEYVSHHVPYVYGYLMRLELKTGAEEMITDEEGNRYYSFGIGETDEKGTFTAVRSFAMNAAGDEIYEYDDAGEQWYLREEPVTEISPEMMQADLQYQDSPAGFAWIGKDSIGEDWLKRCPWISDLHTVDSDGSEYYLIVPREPGTNLGVNRIAEGKAVDTYYASADGVPIIVRTGDPDRLSELEISALVGTRRAAFMPYHAWNPIYDTANGELVMNLGDVDYYGLIADRDRLQETILAAYPDMKQNIASGMTMDRTVPEIVEIGFRPCWAVHYGTDHEGMFTRERTFAVSDDYMHVFEYSTAEDTWYEHHD
ncbi:MAG: hypothetical protein IKF51_07290 [Solobacterium sp.]|nr:hypothetical protein [Solobacterium sp.]